MTDQINQKLKTEAVQQYGGKTSIKRVGLIIIVALFIISLAWLGGWLRQDGQLVSLSSLLEKENKKLEMPIGFPEGLPLLEPNNVLQAYTRDQRTKDITIAIDSKKSAEKNFNYYVDYGKSNDWEISEARSTTDISPGKLLLRKNKLMLSFSFEDTKKGGSKIIISSTVFNVTVDKFTNPFLNQPKPKEEKIPAKAGQSPEGFPEDFPLNGKTEITEAYTLKVENQAGAAYVIKFTSDQTKETNIKFYQDWFKNNNWLLGEQKSEGEATLITAGKPFVHSVEVRIVQSPNSTSEAEVRWRRFSK